MDALRPGDPARIGGYRLLGRLGAGGMGVVYLGRTDSGALAAVKVILPEYAGDEGFRARFRREAEAVLRVDSPWAVPVTGAGTEGEQPWLATEFVPGPTLFEVVAGRGPLPVRGLRPGVRRPRRPPHRPRLHGRPPSALRRTTGHLDRRGV